MKNEFTHAPFEFKSLLERFTPYPKSHDLATHLFKLHELILGSFDALHNQLKPILSIQETMETMGVPGGAFQSLINESDDLKRIISGLVKRDRELQTTGANYLAKGLSAIAETLDNEGANGDIASELCSLTRSACIDSLPERCKTPWLNYCQEVEIAIASSLRKVDRGPQHRI